MNRQRTLMILSLFLLMASLAPMEADAAPSQNEQSAPPLVFLMRGDLWAFSESDTQPRQLTEWGYNQPPAVSPDGRTVAYASVSEIAIDALRRFGDTPNVPPANIWLYDLMTNQSQRIASQPGNATFGSGNATETFVRRSSPAWSPDGTALAWVEHLANTNMSQELVIYDVARGAERRRYGLTISGDQPVLGPVWGMAGIALRAPLVAANATQAQGVGAEMFLIFDNNGDLKNSFQYAPPLNVSIYDFAWVSQGVGEFLGLLYNNGVWSLVDPATGVQAALTGQPERVTATQVSSAGVYPATGPVGPSGFAWVVRMDGQVAALGFTGWPGQVAVSPDGRAVAYSSDAVYIVRGGQVTRVPGTEGINGAYVTWGWNTWRAQQRIVAQPTLPPPPTPRPAAPVVTLPGGLCVNSPAPRLAVGMNGRVTTSPPFPNSLNLLPGRPSRNPSNYRLALIPAGAAFTVTAGPICADELAWWQVNFNGIVGWTAEGEGRVYWLEPAGIVPPPTPLPTVCTLAPRLIVGQRGVVTPGLPNALRSQPSRNPAISAVIGQIPGTGIFTVLAGPVCGDGLYWYQVNYNGQVGWTAEGESGVYWLEPSGIVPPSPQPPYCPLTPRLTVGAVGRVTPGTPNALRSAPGRNRATSSVIGEIPGGGVFAVMSGPVCADGFNWWQVTYAGQVGWTAEGENGVYWLEPWQ